MRRNKEGGEREEGLAGMTPSVRSTRQKSKHATRVRGTLQILPFMGDMYIQTRPGS